MSNKKQTVIIVGAGPIGLLSAKLFLDRGFIVKVIEKQTSEAHSARLKLAELSRLYALSRGSFAIINQDLGLEIAEEDLQPINQIFINDGKCRTIFDPKTLNESCFGYMVEENKLFDYIYKSTQSYGEDFELEFECEVENIIEREQKALLDTSAVEKLYDLKLTNGKTLQADLIIIADGKNSQLRRQLGVEISRVNHDEYGLVFEIEHLHPHKGLAVETFLPIGPLALLPKKNPNHSAVVFSGNKKHIAAFQALSTEAQKEVLQPHLLKIYKEFEFISEFKSYPIEWITVHNLVKGNCILAGDAAHAIHPIAGQGFNLGVRDIGAIYNIMQNSSERTDIVANILRKYEGDRMQDIAKLTNSTYTLAMLFANNNPLLKIARRVGLEIFEEMPMLKQSVMKYAMGLKRK